MAQGEDLARTHLAEEVELARLVDLCSERLGLNIEYDAATLKGAATLRLGSGVSDGQLWVLTNQLLASRGFTSIRMPGGEVLSIVKLPAAAGLARVEESLSLETIAGFVTVVVRLEHRPAKDVVDVVKLLLSKPGGSVTALDDENRILLSDLRPRIDQVLRLIRHFDVPGAATVIKKVPSQYLNAMQLASLVTAAATARNAIDIKPLEGRLTPIPDGSAVVLIAPEDQVSQWLDLIERFDQRQAVETRSYAPKYFVIREVAGLLEQTSRDPGPRGSGGRWRVVSDELTSTLIVTATPAEHEKIEALIERLDSVPPEARRPVRAFPIRNRSVQEIVDVLTRLVEAGVLEAGDDEPRAGSDGRPVRQRTERRVLPPGAEPIVPSTGRQPSGRPYRASAVGRAGAAPGQAPLTLTADEGTNTLIAIGEPRRLAQLEELIRTLDVRQPQVMIEVLVVSLTEGDTFDLGVELEHLEISGSTLITLSSLFGLGTPGLDSAGAPAGAGGTALVLSPGDFRVLVRLLETINDGRSLNIPKVLVNNNQQATLDSVLQQPFTSTNASQTVATTSFGGTQDAGTTVTVAPQIAEGDHLVLEYSVSLSTFVGESSDPSIPPPRQQTTLQSVVTIPDGYTVAVGGLEVVTEAEAVSQVPLLGDIPILGELFKSRSRSRSVSRFYVFIRANVLRHGGFEGLKYMSDREVMAAGVDDGWPRVEPRVIR